MTQSSWKRVSFSIGNSTGSRSAPNTLASTSRAAAEHLRRFQSVSGPSSASPPSSSSSDSPPPDMLLSPAPAGKKALLWSGEALFCSDPWEISSQERCSYGESQAASNKLHYSLQLPVSLVVSNLCGGKLLFHLTQYVFELLRLYVIEPKKLAMLAMNLTSQSR